MGPTVVFSTGDGNATYFALRNINISEPLTQSQAHFCLQLLIAMTISTL